MSTATTTLPVGTWAIDPAHTEVGFSARHLMVSKVRGSFTDVSGTVTVADPIAGSSAQVTIQAASIDTGNADRDAHLRTADFLNVEEFPEITFASTSFDGSSLVGDLTILGVTKPVTLDVELGGVADDPYGNTKAGFEATGTINRSDWGVSFNMALETGGVLVSEKITLTLDVQLVKQA